MAYFSLLEGAVSSVDDFATMAITKSPKDYSLRISLTHPEMNDVLFQQINAVNNACHIIVEYSKSVKKGNLYFKIILE